MVALSFVLSHGPPVALVLLWLASILAVVRDARTRIANGAGVKAAGALAALLPLGGALLYLCVRPLETRLERRERRVIQLLLELGPSEGQVELGDVGEPKRLAVGAGERAHSRLDVTANGNRRRGDEADRQHPADEPLLVDRLQVTKARRQGGVEEAAAV